MKIENDQELFEVYTLIQEINRANKKLLDSLLDGQIDDIIIGLSKLEDSLKKAKKLLCKRLSHQYCKYPGNPSVAGITPEKSLFVVSLDLNPNKNAFNTEIVSVAQMVFVNGSDVELLIQEFDLFS